MKKVKDKVVRCNNYRLHLYCNNCGVRIQANEEYILDESDYVVCNTCDTGGGGT